MAVGLYRHWLLLLLTLCIVELLLKCSWPRTQKVDWEHQAI